MNRWIIQREANDSGSRANQTWGGLTPPDGYVWTTEDDIMNIYVPFKGFVDLEVEEDTVTKMTGNQELLDKWNEEHPDPKPREEQISDDEAIDIITGNISNAEALNIITGGNEK